MSQSWWLTGDTTPQNFKRTTLSKCRSFTRIATTWSMIFVQPKVAACFDIFTALLQTEIEKTCIALETIHHHDRFICTRLRWKYVCSSSSKYSNLRRRKSTRRKSVKSCYSTSTKPLIPYFSSFVFCFFLCWWHCIITAQGNTADCYSWYTCFQWCKFSIRNITFFSGSINLNNSSFGFQDWW